MGKFASGKFANANCDRCGQRYKYNELKPLVINKKVTAIRVCPECFEPDHPQFKIGDLNVFDPQALRDPRREGGLQDSRNINWGWNPIYAVEGTGEVGTVSVTATSLI
tara:strand:- start:112 stop:435 length:324 start_codon:yes stop_codon:yes gene_type:complete